jgi:hypothetical protein
VKYFIKFWELISFLCGQTQVKIQKTRILWQIFNWFTFCQLQMPLLHSFQTPKSYVIDPIEMMFVQMWIVMFTFWHDPTHYIPPFWHRLVIAKLIGKIYIYYISYLLVLSIEHVWWKYSMPLWVHEDILILLWIFIVILCDVNRLSMVIKI